MRQQTCASDKVNCEQADVKLPGTSHLLVLTNFVCSIIAGNIKPGHCTASALTSSAERDFLQEHVPPVSLLPDLSLAPFTFLLIALTQQGNTVSFRIKKWIFFNSVTDGAVFIFTMETLEIKDLTIFCLKDTLPSTDLDVRTLAFVRCFQCHCKTIYVLIHQMDMPIYWISLRREHPREGGKVTSIFCQKSVAVRHSKFTT